MKSIILTFALLTLFSLTLFPQHKMNKPSFGENITDPFDKNSKTVLEEHQRGIFDEGFSAASTRTIINKTLLENGFLLIEYIHQDWGGLAWVNHYKYSYSYDVNNNWIGRLQQHWNGSAWVNSSKDSFSYDVNNIRIEQLTQSWNGSVWVNSSKTSRSYDGNNNMIELLF